MLQPHHTPTVVPARGKKIQRTQDRVVPVNIWQVPAGRVGIPELKPAPLGCLGLRPDQLSPQQDLQKVTPCPVALAQDVAALLQPCHGLGQAWPQQDLHTLHPFHPLLRHFAAQLRHGYRLHSRARLGFLLKIYVWASDAQQQVNAGLQRIGIQRMDDWQQQTTFQLAFQMPLRMCVQAGMMMKGLVSLEQ